MLKQLIIFFSFENNFINILYSMETQLILEFSYEIKWKVGSGRNKGEEKKAILQNKYAYDVTDIKNIKREAKRIALREAKNELTEISNEPEKKMPKFNKKTVEVVRVLNVRIKRQRGPKLYTAVVNVKAGAKKYTFTREGVEVKNDDEKKTIAETIAQEEYKKLRDAKKVSKKTFEVVDFRFLIKQNKSRDVIDDGVYSVTMKVKYYNDKKQLVAKDIWVTVRIKQGKVDDDSDERVKCEFLKEKKSNVDAIVTLQGELNAATIADEIGRSYVDFDKVSDVEFESHESPTFTPIKEIALENVPMKQSLLKYNFIYEKDEQTGECVIDYIIRVCQEKKYLTKTLTRPYIKKYFGNVEDGITTTQIINFARDHDMSVHALTPLMETFESYVPENSKICLVFIVNNGHCYGISDETLKKSIAQKNKITLEDFTFKVKYNDYDVFDYYNTALKAIINDSKQVVLVQRENLNELIHMYIQETKQMIYNINFNGNYAMSFEDPLKKKIIIAAEDLDKRKEAAAKMKVEFTNQSWTQLGKMLYSMNYGKLKESEYSADLVGIFEKYPLRGYITRLTLSNNIDVDSYDICRCYTSILMSNDVEYNVFSAMNMVEEFNGKFVPGEYYISKTFYMGEGTIKVSRGWYPLVFVKYALKYIKLEDIRYVIKASNVIPADAFKKFATDVHENYENGKFMLNCFIGDLKRDKMKRTLGCMTDDYKTAMGLLMNEREKERKARYNKLGNIHFIRSDVVQESYKGHTPIWRHIIASSLIKLDELYNKLKEQADIKVVAYNIDCIKIKKGCDIKVVDKPQPGDIRKENSNKYRGMYIKDLPENPEYEHVNYKWKYHEEDLEFIRNNGCFVSGKGGSGKTWSIIQTFNKETDIAFAKTNKACCMLRKGGVDVHTFDSFFPEDNREQALSKLEKYKNVYIDEMSMVSSDLYGLMMRAKYRYPHLKFKLFGQCMQCNPVEHGKWYDYETAKAIMYLVDGNRIELSYKGKRYDEELSNVLDYLAENGTLKEELCYKKWKTCYTNLCARKSTRRRLNRECYERFVNEFQPEMKVIGGIEYAIGMPIVINTNRPDLEVYNSQRYKIVAFSDECVELNDKKIPFKDFGRIVDYGFAMTIHQMQGDEIRGEDYCINDLSKRDRNGEWSMDVNMLYTALSRGVTLDKIHFKYTSRVFERKRPPTDAIVLSLKPAKIEGKIYAITDGEKWYVGSTVTTLEERFERHKLKPVNKRMKEFMLLDVKIELIKEVVVYDKRDLLRAEDRCIREFKEQGKELLNCKYNVKGMTANELKVEIKQMDIVRFKITKDEKQKMFRIRYNDNGKKIDKKFRYASIGEEEAYKKAVICRDELIKQYY